MLAYNNSGQADDHRKHFSSNDLGKHRMGEVAAIQLEVEATAACLRRCDLISCGRMAVFSATRYTATVGYSNMLDDETVVKSMQQCHACKTDNTTTRTAIGWQGYSPYLGCTECRYHPEVLG